MFAHSLLLSLPLVVPWQTWFKLYLRTVLFDIQKILPSCETTLSKQAQKAGRWGEDRWKQRLSWRLLFTCSLSFFDSILPPESKPKYFPVLYFLKFSLQRTITFDTRSIHERKPYQATKRERARVANTLAGCRVEGSITRWKLTGCSWGFLNRSETKERELGWTDTWFGFFKGHKGTILCIFHFFDFTACKAAQKGYIAANFCQDDVKMSQTRTSAVNAKCDLCLSLKQHELSCLVPCPAIFFKAFRSIWNMLFVISLHFITSIDFLKHMSNERVFRLTQVFAGLHIVLMKIWTNWHDLLENRAKCYCIIMAA